MKAFVALGSNLGNRAGYLLQGLIGMSQLPRSRLGLLSRVYVTQPWGPPQGEYLNMVAELETELSPHALLEELKTIEESAGRTRSLRWGPRTLDLDLLLYETLTLEEPELTLPHPGLRERPFVLIPLAELAPELRLPSGERIGELAERVGSQGLRLFAARTDP
jgi:2-amino-4-hydroxy-6-hydroxymethyldihydropteridine diphosphokinase